MAIVGEVVEPIVQKPAFDKDKVVVIFVLGGPGAGEAFMTRTCLAGSSVIRERDTVCKTRRRLWFLSPFR
jgi:hypothetical protein